MIHMNSISTAISKSAEAAVSLLDTDSCPFNPFVVCPSRRFQGKQQQHGEDSCMEDTQDWMILEIPQMDSDCEMDDTQEWMTIDDTESVEAMDATQELMGTEDDSDMDDCQEWMLMEQQEDLDQDMEDTCEWMVIDKPAVEFLSAESVEKMSWQYESNFVESHLAHYFAQLSFACHSMEGVMIF